jgi:hypothetical protein
MIALMNLPIMMLTGYLMCFFGEKISDALLVGLQDFEFAVSCLLIYFV